MKKSKNKKRYQECSKLERIWRNRWYITVPFIFLYKLITGMKIFKDEEINGKIYHTDKYFKASPKLIWSFSVGDAERKMNYYYTMEEVKEKIKKY